MFGNWHVDTLRLYEVIASPIVLFGPELSVSFAHGKLSDERPYYELAQTWSRNIGEPLLLSAESAIGGLRLPERSIVLIGPIAPLKVTIEGKTHYLENKTAQAAANLWLKLVSEFCRRSVHAQEPDDLELSQLGSSELGLGEAQLEQELSQLLGLKISAAHQNEPVTSTTLSAVLDSNFDLSRIVAAQGTAYNPFDGNFSPDVVEPKEEDAFIAALNLGKISTVHHHNQLRNEVLMQEAVREGDLTKLRWANSLATKGKAGILGLTPLRHWQNHAHISNVLASRAAIDAGIAPEEAYVLSDKLFLVVEQVTDPLLAKHMRFVIWRAFTEQVKRHRDELKARSKTLATLTQASTPGSPEPVLVLKARYLMAQRLMEPLTLNTIASELGCTPEHLARSFKRYHHQTVHEYLVAERLKLAKELLLESNQKVGDIAQLLHFASSSHFGAAFKEREHLSPLKWRKLHAKVCEG